MKLPSACSEPISIHASREGSDPHFFDNPYGFHKFLSTHPVRGATLTMRRRWLIVLFLSTHPVRGATPALPHPDRHSDISIHASREGSDLSSPLYHNSATRFLSTHPVRGATAKLNNKLKEMCANFGEKNDLFSIYYKSCGL